MNDVAFAEKQRTDLTRGVDHRLLRKRRVCRRAVFERRPNWIKRQPQFQPLLHQAGFEELRIFLFREELIGQQMKRCAGLRWIELPARSGSNSSSLIRTGAGPLAADRVHRPRRSDKLGGVDFVPDPLLVNVLADGRGDLLIRRAVAQQAANVGLLDREQAIAQLAVAGEPDAVAVQAERSRSPKQ